MIQKVLLTAVREFKATALTKAFIFGAVIMPAIIGGGLWAAGAAGLFTQEAKPTEGTVAVVDPTGGALAQRLQALLHPEEGSNAPIIASPAPKVQVERISPDEDLEDARKRVLEGELLALAQLTAETLEPDGSLDLLVSSSASARDIDTIENAIRRAVTDYRLEASNLDVNQVRRLLAPPRIATRTLTEEGETAGSEVILRMLPYAALFLLVLAIFTGSGYLLTSTVEEKASRVMEVLLSGMSPMQLMTGKIIGQGLVGLVMLAIYAGLGVVAAKQFKVFTLIPADLFVWLFVYFIMGYFIYAALNAAIGAAVNEVREAQALQGPVMGVTIFMIYLAMFSTTISDNPHSTLAQILSFIPLATPFVMPVRLGFVNDPMPAWQLWLAPAVGFAGMFASVWLAAKIFRVGVLMYGQPPTLRTLVKWLRKA